MAKRESFWKTDWFVALAVGLLFMSLFFTGAAGVFDRLELSLYDAGVRGTARGDDSDNKVSVVAIDEKSIEFLGRWPWSRTVIADMINLLSGAQARVIGLSIFYTEPQLDPGLAYIQQIESAYRASASARRDADFSGRMEELLASAYIDLDADSALAQAIADAGNVILPMFLRPGRPIGRPDTELPDFVIDNIITDVVKVDPNAGAPMADDVTLPLDGFGMVAAGLGHLNLSFDIDGGVRSDSLAFDLYGEHLPSLALAVAARSLNLRPDDIALRLGEGLNLGNLSITAADRLRMLSAFYEGEADIPAIPTYSFVDVLSGDAPAELFKGQVVLIGPTATGLGTKSVTPISPAMTPVEMLANFVTSILQEDFYVRPAWTAMAELGVFVVITLYLMFLMPRLGAGVGAGVSLVLFLTLLGVGYYMVSAAETWLRLATPATLLLVGHMVLTTKRFLVTERGKEKVESASFEDNKMLGLSFQAQGQLDMALDKFRKIPMDDSVADLLYSLAMDFERKRQFGKAGSVYDMILGYDKKFKDVAERKSRAANLEGTVVLGGAAGAGGGTLILDPNHKPTLGRYEVDKELGKGAMGIVYLGRDPKINRVVAIKTMALAQEFEGPELAEAKERFFREAETAGRLNHPNIVTIYDAGEEQELAYIAMEFMEGSTLEDYCQAGALMPPYSVMVVISKVAEALDYAHSNGIVHRDIKPANVMLQKDKTVKVMDFGIARVTESSKTKTGVVMGTPSYMSPEQLSGAKVDGRSDLFSLGVMMFEMLTGSRPFKGDSMATLMFAIAQQPHDQIATVNPDLPPCVGNIIDKALAKDLNVRYASGHAMAADIVACARQMRADASGANPTATLSG